MNIEEFCNKFGYEFGYTEYSDDGYFDYKYKAENHDLMGFPTFYANSPMELAEKMLDWREAPRPTLMEHYFDYMNDKEREEWKVETLNELEDED